MCWPEELSSTTFTYLHTLPESDPEEAEERTTSEDPKGGPADYPLTKGDDRADEEHLMMMMIDDDDADEGGGLCSCDPASYCLFSRPGPIP
ncbi:hypothetical protein Tco_0223260 [Tanacetum coccineum]